MPPQIITRAEARARKKERACPHPSRHVHAAIDARFETCDLCHFIGVAPINAPWITAWDEAQPVPPPPPLFAGYEG